MNKICSSCKIEKDSASFCVRRRSLDGLNIQCRSCVKEYKTKNKEKLRIRSKEYEALKADEISRKRKEYNQKNKSEIQKKKTAYVNKKEKSDPLFKLARRLRNRIYKVTKGIVKTGSSVSDLGCSVQEFKAYLESLFKPGMSWENYSQHGWHVDHIVPLASFDLTNRDEFLKACHYRNLQPLWAEENLKKGNKVGT